MRMRGRRGEFAAIRGLRFRIRHRRFEFVWTSSGDEVVVVEHWWRGAMGLERGTGHATFFVNVERWRRVEKEISISTTELSSKKIRRG
jgi:hypothetical protein